MEEYNNKPITAVSIPSKRQQDAAALVALKVPIPACECERLDLLRETELLDSQVNESEYARYTNLAARICKVSKTMIVFISTF
jgi:hypothetical protein